MDHLTQRNVIALLTIVCCMSSAGCSDRAESVAEVQRTDSAGIEIVTAPAKDHPLEWRFERLQTIASDNGAGGAGVFDPNPAALRSDSLGRLYVLDYRGARVIVFNDQGGFLRSLGRRGGGPGELNYPLSFDVQADGTVSVFDVGKRRLVRFAGDGSILPELELGKGFFGGSFVLAREVRVYDYQGEGTAGARVAGLYRAAAQQEGGLIAQITSPEPKAFRLESCGMGFRGLPPIFHPAVRWSARDSWLALAPDASYEIRILDGEREVRRIRRAVPERVATRELAEQQLGEGMKVRTEDGERTCRSDEVAEKQGFASRIPLIGKLAYAPNGALWVQRGGVRGEAPPADVFGPDGAYLGSLPGTLPFPAAFLPGERMAAVERDELDVGRITIYRIKR